MKQIEHIVLLAKTYGAAAGVEISTVSSRVFGDGKKIAALESGSDLTTRRADQAIRWFAINWPDGVVWPADVPKPEMPVLT